MARICVAAMANPCPVCSGRHAGPADTGRSRRSRARPAATEAKTPKHKAFAGEVPFAGKVLLGMRLAL
ncbi:hypothetical protein BOSEA31B_15165 [Hyphomicrobiales bacterium]|nr:hypothetical protein BOSEA31B_15165 [Hyphomicrobiales bacterium]CAH1701656.1 hypothetical protein BOSEA1005_21356 [Hyphomicrobiales bacterium]CAI0345822.1 hypothetical protein BO1005MUT1_450050 [Hyphomicrobiales bacterium]